MILNPVFALTAVLWFFTSLSFSTPSLLNRIAMANPSPQEAQTILYASPNGKGNGSKNSPYSLTKARDKVRTLNQNMTGDIIVYLRGGTYSLTNTLSFGPQDSGTNGHHVIYRAYPGETPHLSGGKRITQWKPSGGGVFRAKVGALRFRQLYVNGKRAVRARTPNEGNYFRIRSWDPAKKAIVLKGRDAATWKRKTGAPIPGANNAEAVIQQSWNQTRLRIASIDRAGSNAMLIAQEPERNRTFSAKVPEKEKNQAYHFENAREFLNAPGEWFLSSSQELFYKPRKGEKLSRATVIAPRLETLLRLEGTSNTPIRGLKFEGITFEHTTWRSPDTKGYVGLQGGIANDNSPLESMMPAGVTLKFAQDIQFERNVFRLMGGSAIDLLSGTQDTTWVGNVVTAISGNGISIAIPPEDAKTLQEKVINNVVRNNYISRVAQDYYGSVGIFVGYASDTKIEHNEICELPYTGISVGWGWTKNDTSLRNNFIRYNHIHHVMQLIHDGGGIYTLSKQPGTIIAENYIHDLRRSRWTGKSPIAGIYLDQASSFMTVQGNVMRNVDSKIYEQKSHGNPAFNNTFVNNDGGSKQVIDNSGLERNHRKIKKKLISFGCLPMLEQFMS